MNNINFEGKIIKPNKSGYYKCPFGCHNSNYPQPKWKTELGFMKHLQGCFMKPSSVLIRDNEKLKHDNQLNEWKNKLEEIKPIILSNLGLNINDDICYVKCVVIKPTHEQKFNRMVRVRYEPILRFDAVKTTITSIGFFEPKELPTIENATNLIYFNNGVTISELENWNDAQRIAKEKTEADKKYRDECSSYR